MVSPFHRVRGHEISYETVFHATNISVSLNGSVPYLISYFHVPDWLSDVSGARNFDRANRVREVGKLFQKSFTCVRYNETFVA